MTVVKTNYNYNNFSIDDVLDYVNAKRQSKENEKKKKKKDKPNVR